MQLCHMKYHTGLLRLLQYHIFPLVIKSTHQCCFYPVFFSGGPPSEPDLSVCSNFFHVCKFGKLHCNLMLRDPDPRFINLIVCTLLTYRRQKQEDEAKEHWKIGSVSEIERMFKYKSNICLLEALLFY